MLKPLSLEECSEAPTVMPAAGPAGGRSEPSGPSTPLALRVGVCGAGASGGGPDGSPRPVSCQQEDGIRAQDTPRAGLRGAELGCAGRGMQPKPGPRKRHSAFRSVLRQPSGSPRAAAHYCTALGAAGVALRAGMNRGRGRIRIRADCEAKPAKPAKRSPLRLCSLEAGRGGAKTREAAGWVRVVYRR